MAAKRTPRRCACGATYDDFRTELDFGAVRRMLWNVPDPTRPGWWRQKRRSSVLGHWRAMRIALFRQAHGHCASALEAA